jgi:2-polyprenyl-3-methyl-5-hydroxy-6-metoxy-1,4-benzoquinol methylase
VNDDRVSSHYSGAEGAAYFAWQRAIGELGGRLNLFKFAPYVRVEHAVCDFGCGGGYLLEHLPAREKVGVEVNPDARRVAAERGLTVVSSSDELPDAYFDVVVSNHALEHAMRPLDEVALLRRKLRIGGIAVFCLPIDEWRTQTHYRADDISHHLYTWTPQLIGNLMSDAGLRVRELRILRHAWSPKIHRLVGWSGGLFHLACFVNAIVKRRYQLLVVAERAK